MSLPRRHKVFSFSRITITGTQFARRHGILKRHLRIRWYRVFSAQEGYRIFSSGTETEKYELAGYLAPLAQSLLFHLKKQKKHNRW